MTSTLPLGMQGLKEVGYTLQGNTLLQSERCVTFNDLHIPLVLPKTGQHGQEVALSQSITS